MKLITLIRYDLKNYFKSKASFLAMIILPIIFIVGGALISKALFVNHSFIEPISLVIVDKDQSFYTDFFIKNILETPSLQENMEIIQTDEASGNQLLMENKAAGMVIIPENFSHNMQASVFEPIRVIGNSQKPLQAKMIKEGLESATNLISAAQSAVFTVTHYAREDQLSLEEFDKVFQRAAMSFSLKALGRDRMFSQTIKTPWMDLEAIYYYFSSLLVFFLSLYGLRGIYLYIREKENKITTRIKTSGGSLGEIIFSKWISLSLFLFIQGSIVFLIFVGLKLFKTQINIRLGLATLIIISGAISSLTLLIASFSKNDYIGSILVFSTSIIGVFLGGGIVPYAYMPNFVEKIGKLTLNHWAIQGLIYAIFGSDNSLVLKSNLILGVLTLFCLAFTTTRLRWEERSL